MKSLKTISLIALVIFSLPFSGAFAKGKAPVTGMLNINTASAEELTQLPGIGQSKAEAIVTYRQAHPFKDISELVEVKGIGPKMLEKLQAYLTVDGQSTLKTASASSGEASSAMAGPQK